MSRRYVLMREDWILLERWIWVTLPFAACGRYPVWVFRSRGSADRARRSYGRGVWRRMAIVQVRS